MAEQASLYEYVHLAEVVKREYENTVKVCAEIKVEYADLVKDSNLNESGNQLRKTKRAPTSSTRKQILWSYIII